MSTNVKIEIDERTADVLHARAAELGVTVSELVAELATLDSEPIAVDSDEIAELDRRWKDRSGPTHGSTRRVVRWLRTWGIRAGRQPSCLAWGVSSSFDRPPNGASRISNSMARSCSGSLTQARSSEWPSSQTPARSSFSRVSRWSHFGLTAT